jgi:hypothetical protein
MLRYGCHAGHTFAADTVLSAQADEKLLECCSALTKSARRWRAEWRSVSARKGGIVSPTGWRFARVNTRKMLLLVRELIGTGMARRAAGISDDKEATGGDAGIET